MNLSVGRAVGTLTSPSYYKTVVLVTAGMALSTLAVGWLQDNFLDLDVPFEDAIYALMAVFLVRIVLSGRTSMLVAAGAGVGAVATVAEETGLI